MIRIEEFKQEHLNEHPVWASDDSNDYLMPVTHYDPLPTDLGDLVVRARFIAPDGRHLDGSVCVYSPPPFAISLHVYGDERVGFNKALPQFAADELKRLYELLGVEPFPLFPLRYETDFHFPGEPNIVGVFDMEIDQEGT